MSKITIHLTELGEEKVGYDTIPSKDEYIEHHTGYITVKSTFSGKTYLLKPEDIEYMS